MNVLVIVDTILDEYIHCSPLGMSQKIQPYCIPDKIKFLGGAGIAVAHQIGCKCETLSVVGSDMESEMVNFLKIQCRAYIFIDHDRPTNKSKDIKLKIRLC